MQNGMADFSSSLFLVLVLSWTFKVVHLVFLTSSEQKSSMVQGIRALLAHPFDESPSSFPVELAKKEGPTAFWNL